MASPSAMSEDMEIDDLDDAGTPPLLSPTAAHADDSVQTRPDSCPHIRAYTARNRHLLNILLDIHLEAKQTPWCRKKLIIPFWDT